MEESQIKLKSGCKIIIIQAYYLEYDNYDSNFKVPN